VVDDPDACEKGGLIAGLLEEEATVAEGFFIEERDGGGGRVIGVAR
jgi:hypothetical protein